MSGKSFCLGVLVAALLGLGEVRGQSAGTDYSRMAPPVTSTAPAAAAPEGAPPPPAPGTGGPPGPVGPWSLSSWILYPRTPGCCCATGGDGDIGYNIYLRSGLSFPVGAGPLGDTLHTGWDIEGGARTYFFNPPADAAWVVDLGLSNIYQKSSQGQPVLLVLGSGLAPQTLQAVSVRSLNRTYGNASLGYEQWLYGNARACDECGWTLRAGFDAGGRYGTADLELREIKHRSPSFGGVFAAIHADASHQCGCGCITEFGVRAEYSYTWTDILQHQNPSDLQDINLLLTATIRF